MNESDPFIAARTFDIQLDDGMQVRIRPIVPADRDDLAQGMEELSEESRYLRFLRSVDHLSGRELSYLTDVDYDTHFAWVAMEMTEEDRHGIGVARYVLIDHGLAEAAVVVLDRYQRMGLGGILLRLVAESAYENGIRRFRAWVAPGNTVVTKLAERWHLARRTEEGAVVIDMPLPLPTASLVDSSLYETLREAAAGRIHIEDGHADA